MPKSTLTKRMVHEPLREQFTVQKLMDLCDRQGRPAYPVAIFGSGALGCTLPMSAISAGFKPIWGTEVEKHMRQMWVSVCATVCYGDTNEKKWLCAEKPTYVKSSTHCGTFPTGGLQEGDDAPPTPNEMPGRWHRPQSDKIIRPRTEPLAAAKI